MISSFGNWILCNTEDSWNQARSLQHSAHVQVFAYMKLENSHIEISDLSKTGQNGLKRYKLKEKTYF